MILLDTNLLVYTYVSSLPQHVRTKEWLQRQFDSRMRIGLPWHSLLGFVRLTSNPRTFGRAQSVAESWAQVRNWLSMDNVWIPQATERHLDILHDLFASGRVSTAVVMDTHLAALAIEHGLVLCSNDSDFARFSKLRWFNPLE